ncbi:hypothetical protein ABIA85_009059 [Bradyrhizobium sp. LA6.10]
MLAASYVLAGQGDRRPAWLSLMSTGEWPSVLADSKIQRSAHHCDIVET